MGKKKSIFVKNLKTFKSDFTGEEQEYKINNALWVFMERDFDLSQTEWAEKYDERQAHYGSIFATALLNANGFDTTFEEVTENTDIQSISELIVAYTQSLYEGIEAPEEDDDEDDDEESPR